MITRLIWLIRLVVVATSLLLGGCSETETHARPRTHRWPTGSRRSGGGLLARQVQRHGFTNEVLQCVVVDRVVLLDVDGTPDLPLEAGVEQTRGIAHSGTLEEGQLDHVLVGLAGTDAPVVGPDRCSGVRGLHPLPLLDDVGVRFLDDPSHLGEPLAAPVAQLADLLVYPCGSTRRVICHSDPPCG